MKFYRKQKTQKHMCLTRGLISQLANLRILCCSLSCGRFPGVRILYADVSEHSVPSLCRRFGTICQFHFHADVSEHCQFHIHADVSEQSVSSMFMLTFRNLVPSSSRRFGTLAGQSSCQHFGTLSVPSTKMELSVPKRLHIKF